MTKRCNYIVRELKAAKEPITATTFAEKLGVSRQIIVGDVAILRAAGHDIIATSRGYILNTPSNRVNFGYTGILACRHTTNDVMLDELNTIVDNGGTVIDVKVEHQFYGELVGRLDISSRYDVARFMQQVEEQNTPPLSTLTDGVHLHTIGCSGRMEFERISAKLVEKGIAMC